MALFEAKLNLDTLYYVAKEMDSYASRQDYATYRIEMETRIAEDMTRTSLAVVQERLETEKAILQNLESQLSDAQWHLANCRETDDEGNSTGEREHWSRVIAELESAVARQEEEVDRIAEAYQDVARLAEDANSRAIQIRSRAQAYRSRTTGLGTAASAAIRQCAEAVQDYWNLNL